MRGRLWPTCVAETRSGVHAQAHIGLVASASVPVIAAGGVDGPESVPDLLNAGAEAVAVGTILLLTDR
ncbi:nitronate monooxygenase [Leifsonia sp. 21MFCrub1.1]|uniref:nitronate monooxygenase n=1 Tax=Leifsonia sp. 21MFCrub1.1 TaxID=1798223 RepID=UPI0012FDC069|nr:nitronate monooxygenase [Leifsonia sp. 21MFCrub1.1]